MTPSETLHLEAAAYAHKQVETHKQLCAERKEEPMNQKMYERIWVAHYEGYIAGYDAKLKEKNA